MRSHLEAVIKAFKKELAAVQAKIDAHLRAHCELNQLVARLTTIPGVGRLTATIALAELPVVRSDSDPRALSAWCGTRRRH